MTLGNIGWRFAGSCRRNGILTREINLVAVMARSELTAGAADPYTSSTLHISSILRINDG